MKAAEFLDAVKDGRVKTDDEYDNEYLSENPQQIAFHLWNGQTVWLDGQPIEVLYNLRLGEDRGAGHDGQPLKVVWKIGDDYLIAMGQYESWDGEFFPDGVQDAHQVNVPTWLPVGVAPEAEF